MEEELYKVVWLCKYSKKKMNFVWTHYVDDVLNKRMIFSNDDTQEVITIAQDSYGWILTRPLDMDINEN